MAGRPRSAAGPSTGAFAERGSATVLLLAVVAVALLLATMVTGLSRAVAARGAAQGAADLAAVAAAEVAAGGGRDPCAAAARVAGRNGAELVSCRAGAGAMVDVQVRLAVRPLPGWLTWAAAEARAGPVGRGG